MSSPPTHRNAAGEPPALLSDTAVLERLADELTSRYIGVFSAVTVHRYVFESYTALRRTAKVRAHLVSLTGRFAADRLTALAQAQGVIMKTVPEVLFVCVHNAGRSQMAAALLHHHAHGTVNVRSAGSAPADTINPAVGEVMNEIGLDLSQEFPKPLTDDVVRAADVVITMGCGDACPVHPGKRYLDWDLTDPAGKTAAEIRPIRDEIDRRVRELITELTAHPAQS
ncbi:arsenate reductase ArsC [Pseudonocardia sp. D17]|uniref:arsenate reductase ArsC n=1 Tax=Pseudonocardia sp. D17 TaxID=882661 RepID=UPI002B3977F2|nr:low molecular weight phosphatase family protein [Pseudonocardia sp. D17]